MASLGRRKRTNRSKTRVVHCNNSAFDVYIGRPSKWGNPFKMGKDGTREEVIQKYEVWLNQQPRLVAALTELHGKTLGCWCAPLPCHGDVLVRRINDLVREDRRLTERPTNE